MADSINVEISKKILGAPLAFNNMCDPHARVFLKTFFSQANIINFIPGRPEFKEGKLAQEKYDILVSQGLIEQPATPDGNDIDDKPLSGLFTDSDENIQDTTGTLGLANRTGMRKENYYHDGEKTKSVAKERDLRFYSFRTDLPEWRSMVNVLLNEVGSKMIGPSMSGFNVNKYVDLSLPDFWSNGISFYVDGSTTVSESATNDVSESSMEGVSKGVADKARELAFLTGTGDRNPNGSGKGDSDSRSNSEGGMWQNLIAGGASVARAVAGSVSRSTESMAAGENIVFPKIWKSSSFEKSYNLVFKFISPYGDPQSIFEYVYVPFLCLFALAFPRQVKPDSYKSPMLLRIDSPGYMNCDMGMITNFTFVRGGSEGLWSPNGYPLCIDVTLTLTDMYPTLCASSNIALLRQNMGLSSFLDNMAGLNVMRANVGKHLGASMASKLAAFTGIPDAVHSRVRNSIENWLESPLSPFS